jgi:hypothetical protein
MMTVARRQRLTTRGAFTMHHAPVDPNFVQIITLRSEHLEEILELLGEWDRKQADGEIMGYAGLRVLVDRDDPRRLFIVAEFAAVEPGVSAADEAELNNARPETQASAARILALSETEPEYLHFDEVYRTDPFTPGLGREPTP